MEQQGAGLRRRGIGRGRLFPAPGAASPSVAMPHPSLPILMGTSLNSVRFGSEYSSSTFSRHVSCTSRSPTTSIPSPKWCALFDVERRVAPVAMSTARTEECP